MKKLILMLAIVLTGCYNQWGEELQHWHVMPGGDHFKLANQKVLRKHTISRNPANPLPFNAVFGEGCDYHLDVGNDVHDNKLYGFSLGSKWRTWSARIGWRWDEAKEMMRVDGYSWINGKRSIDFITFVDMYEYIDYIVEADSDGFTYTANGVTIRVEGNLSPVINKTRYRLYPYFGGNTKAPNEMRIITSEY